VHQASIFLSIAPWIGIFAANDCDKILDKKCHNVVIKLEFGSQSPPTGENDDDELKRGLLCFLNLPADPIAESSIPRHLTIE